jgi:Trypsin-like peptidase domain
MVATERIALIRYRQGQARYVGSGLRIGTHFVLTADHCVDGTDHVVQCDGGEFPAQVHVRSYDPEVDLAILTVPGARALDPLRYGQVNRSVVARVDGCHALGFPRWKVSDGRIAAQVDGYIPTAEGLPSGATAASFWAPLALKVTGPAIADYPIPAGDLETADSPWAGMSGAVVFTSDVVLGVIRSHNLAEGGGSLTVTPLRAIDQLPADLRHRFWTALEVDDPAGLPMLPVPSSARPRPPGARSRLLIVDDQVGLTVKQLLAGYDCEVVTSIEMWWQLVEDGDLAFDGALVDLHLTSNMNDEYGGEVLRFLRENTSIPALLMSVSPLGWGHDLEKRYGAVGVFYKDRENRFRDIRHAVEDLLTADRISEPVSAATLPGSARRRDRSKRPRE